MKKIIIGYVFAIVLIWLLFIGLSHFTYNVLYWEMNTTFTMALYCRLLYMYTQLYVCPILFFAISVYVLIRCLKEDMSHQFKILFGINVAFLVLNLVLYYYTSLAPIVLQYSVLSALEMFIGLLMVYSMKRRSLS